MKPTKIESTRPHEFAGLTVCVVDDEDDVRRGLDRLISSIGADVRTAPDGGRALEIVRNDRIDIVVSDIRMPRMNGVELLEAIREESPETQVVIMTGFGTIELAVSCMAAGAAHFVAKPFDNHQLLNVVRTIGRKARSDRGSRSRDSEIVAVDPAMRAVLAHVDEVAATRMPVLIEGETGTGKDLIARQVHRRSANSALPFLAVNCAALPDTLLESELFGHRAGAFTGAESDRPGLFPSAEGGTVFLDEVSSMSPAFQGKLLRVLQNRAVRPLGGDSDVDVDFRLIAATNRALDELVEEGGFRQDLLYRLRVLRVAIPPLRKRPDDVSALARLFIERSTPDCRGDGAQPPTLDPEADMLLRGQPWPGNVRELESAVIRALVACHGDVLRPHHFDLAEVENTDPSYEAGKRRAIERFQRRFVEDALSANRGNVSRAAAACGLTRAALQKIMRSLGIKREQFVSG